MWMFFIELKKYSHFCQLFIHKMTRCFSEQKTTSRMIFHAFVFCALSECWAPWTPTDCSRCLQQPARPAGCARCSVAPPPWGGGRAGGPVPPAEAAQQEVSSSAKKCLGQTFVTTWSSSQYLKKLKAGTIKHPLCSRSHLMLICICKYLNAFEKGTSSAFWWTSQYEDTSPLPGTSRCLLFTIANNGEQSRRGWAAQSWPVWVHADQNSSNSRLGCKL